MPSETIEIPDQLVEELRVRFIADSSVNHDLYDHKDVEEIRSNDLLLRRYLQAKKANVDESYTMLTNAMKWRKTLDVNQLNETRFPAEFFQMGGLTSYGQDLTGAQMIILRVKVNKKVKDWTEVLKKYIVFLIEKENLRFEKNEITGVCVVFDCNGAGITNVDIDLLSFIVQTFRDYYPMLLTSVLINELPWILNYLLKLVQTWLPKEQQEVLHPVKMNELGKYVAKEQLPDFLDGTNELPYKSHPKNAPTAQELGDRLGIKQKETDKLLKLVENYIDNGL